MGRFRDARDGGFTLVELLLVVIIIGVLAAIAIPVFTQQKARAVDATVQSDLKSLSSGAETFYAEGLAFPDSPDDFATGHVLNTTRQNTFVSFADIQGYVIYGKAANSDRVFVLASHDGAAPRRALGMTELPTTGPVAGTFGPTQPDLSGATPVTIP